MFVNNTQLRIENQFSEYTLEWGGSCDRTGWYKVRASWYSGINTSPIDLRIENITVADDGNDFAIDDISFGAADINHTSTVHVAPRILNSTITYYRLKDATSYPVSGDVTESLPECEQKTICFRMDEGPMSFHLETNLTSGFEWEIWRQGVKIDLTPNASTNGVAVLGYNTGSPTSSVFDVRLFMIAGTVHPVPCYLTVRLVDRRNREPEISYIQIRVQPQPNAYQSAFCEPLTNGMTRVYGSGAMWNLSPIQTRWIVPPSVLSTANYSLANGGRDLDYNPAALTGPADIFNEVLDPSTGCRSAMTMTISPDPGECDGRYYFTKRGKIESDETIVDELSVSPNPAKDHIRITASKPVAEIILRSANGMLVKRVAGAALKSNISLAGLSNGSYIVRINYKDGTSASRVVIKN